MKIAFNTILLDTEEISVIKEFGSGYEIYLKNTSDCIIINNTHDVKRMKELFFNNGMPDLIIPVDTFVRRRDMLQNLAAARQELIDQQYEIQLVEDAEQVKRGRKIVEDIKAVGIEAYRDTLRGRSNQDAFGGIFSPENFKLKN